MTKRFLSLVAILALVAAACGGDTEGTSTTGSDDETSTTAGADTTTTTAVEATEAVLLSYTLAAGDEFQYEVGLNQHIELRATGDAALMGDEEMPGDAVVDLTGTATFTHVVSDGPEAGTYEIHITGEFTDVSATGTVDGEPIDSSDAPEFASLEPIDLTVVVDEQGNLIQEGETAADPLGGIFGDLGALGSNSPAPGLDPGQFIGPPFSEEEVTVGDTWSEEIEVPGLSEGDPVVTSITSTVTGVDEVDGVEVFVIESNSTTSLIEFDLAEFFAGMFGAFLPEGATDEEVAEFEAMLGELQFLITVDGSTADSTTLFDAEAGVARQSETTGATNISMDMNVPDEETGEMIGFEMEMTLDQDITYRLIAGPSA